ncbi:MAG: rane bound O-acyl transferase family protein, partial [Solirubrobacteraceae bacterium]|nr:rane bound O-acyl transferase family protein [Solirubrobacteraceae bacterium]
PIVLTISWALMSRPHLWKPFIVLASYVFYAGASWRFCLLLAGVTIGNQVAAKLIAATEDEKRRKRIVVAAVVLDLFALGVFKYYSFFVESLADGLDGFGLGMPLPLLTIALPVGISFFTFQAISYTVDVYRRQVEPSPTIDVALYLSFFPHLVAGPIVRAREFLPQLASPRDPKDVAVGSGVFLICLGLVKKVVLADLIARNLVDPVYAVPEAYGSADTMLALYGYAAQIYCDFSGYTDIAIGLALLMGFIFPRNFDRPYSSTSMQEFWRRWHMTLSRFLRDFIYIPLGGNRKGRWKTYRNLMATMVLGGLWHGAAWGFVLWGTIHGSGLAIERFFRNREVKLPGWLGWVLTFHVVTFAWVFFRAPNFSTAGAVFGRLFSGGAATLFDPVVVVAVVLAIGLQLLPERPIVALRHRVEAFNPVALGLGLALTIIIVGSTIPGGSVPPFIYFQF